MRGSTSVGYDQFETSPEAIEQELRPAVCERRLTDRLKTNYSIDYRSVCLAVHRLLTVHHLFRVSVSLRVKFTVMVRDMVKLKFMDHG